MKKFIVIALILLFLSGCTTRTSFGECIGITDTPKPNLVYRLSYWNVFLAFIFSETIVVPAVVIFADLRCPVEKN